MNYIQTFRIVQLVPGVSTKIDFAPKSFTTFEEALTELNTYDPNEVVHYTILPVYSFKKKD